MKQIFNQNFSSEIDSVITLLGGIICCLFYYYVHDVYGFNWNKNIFELASLPSIIFITIHIISLYKSIKKIDYIFFFRKVSVALIFGLSIACSIQSFQVYENKKISNKQINSKFYSEIELDFKEQSREHYFIRFTFKGKKEAISISRQQALRLKAGRALGIQYCIELNLKKGLDSTFILSSYKVNSCR